MQADLDMMAELGWTPSRTDQLRLHHRLGLSAAVSAQLIGGVSRNAVISKRRRLGLMGANPLQSALRAVRCFAEVAEAPARPASFRAPPAQPGDGAASGRRTPLPFMDWPAPADARPKTLEERSPGECTWPLGPADAPGDYRTLFCCAPVVAGRGYCAAHRALAFGGRLAPQLLDSLANDEPEGCTGRPRDGQEPR